MTSRHLHGLAGQARNWVRTLLMSLFLVACGGGVESGGTGGNATASYASGPITGFGSVIVNGVRFDDSGASLKVADADGAARNRDDLKLGMTINVRGTPIAADDSSVATSIVYGSTILGPITSINTGAAALTVLGQSVDVVATTVFDLSQGGAINPLSVGNVIEVYALFDAATQRYRATRIERKASVLFYSLRGVVTNLDTTTRTFMIGTERISYAALGNDVPTGLGNSIVRIALQTSLINGVRPALRLKNGVTEPQDRDEVRIEGLISVFRSSADFSVDGVLVNASQASFPDGTAGLGLGVRVALQGTVSNAVLSATRVQIKSQTQVEDDGFELRGLITSIDRVAQIFVLRGVIVSFAGTVVYQGGDATQLATGTNVEVKGSLSGDGTRLVAARITFKN